MRPSVVAVMLATALAAAQRVVLAQQPGVDARPGATVFRPLLADPKEPQFFAAYLWARSPRLGSRLGSVGFGETIGLVRVRDWQVAIAAGVFSEFNMRSSTTDLLNTDYLVGLPLAYRHGTWAARFSVFHQSSHLGDEYIAHTHAQRVDLTFEAAELLVATEIAPWRVYGGGEYIFAHSPADLRPGVLHGGVEYRAREPVLRVGSIAAGRLVAGLDAKSAQDDAWQVGWSLLAGLELGDPQAAPGTGWRWSVLVKAYTGPAPYGEFFRDHFASVGAGVGFTL
ncbi:MAG TPA: DUF1207 domain-containing protein [Gemmatimonadales bacterium]|nr:DUF1207 domain-containing protein [Gemmatimonadales bacterium]